jgi:exonuclease VII small subunit
LFWRQKAGLDAGRLAEALGLWPQAERIYRQLQQLLPSASDSLEIKIRNARKNIEPSGDSSRL